MASWAGLVSMRLEYNLSRPYPWPRFTLWVTLSSIVLIIILTLVNVLLVGFDIVPGLATDPNAENHSWWGSGLLSAFVYSPGSCQPVSLSKGQVVQTNMSMFNYKILEIWVLNSNPQMVPVSYSANSLGNCTVKNVLIHTDSVRRDARISAVIGCDDPFWSVLQTELIFSDISGLNEVTTYDYNLGISDITTYVKVFGVLDLFARDLLTGWWSTGANAIIYGGSLSDNSLDESSPYKFNITEFIRISADGRDARSLEHDVAELGPGPITNQSLAILIEPANNLISAFIHALHIDLGHWVPNNIYTNATALRATINPANSVTSLFSNGSYLKENPLTPRCSPVNGCNFDYNASWASMILDNTTIAHISPKDNGSFYPSVLHLNYICPRYQLKSTRSLLASVFIGTSSMFMSAWAVFMFGASYLATRKGEEFNCCSCPACQEAIRTFVTRRDIEDKLGSDSLNRGQLNRPITLSNALSEAITAHQHDENDSDSPSKDHKDKDGKLVH